VPLILYQEQELGSAGIVFLEEKAPLSLCACGPMNLVALVIASAVCCQQERAAWPWYGGPNRTDILHEAPLTPDGKGMRVLWQYEGYRRGSMQAEVAISPQGVMFFTSGHDGTSALVQMSRDEAGYRFSTIYSDPQQDRHQLRACSEWRRGHWWDGQLYHVSNHFASHGLLSGPISSPVA
jgi:hypothetical protein